MVLHNKWKTSLAYETVKFAQALQPILQIDKWLHLYTCGRAVS